MENLIEIISLTFLLALVFIYYYLHDKNGLPSNWPVVGMLPAVLVNIHRIHDYLVDQLSKGQSCFMFKGPWFPNTDLLVTTDPANVHHVMSKNFVNYPKGPKFKDIFDIIGDGFSNTDSSIWEYHRNLAKSFVTHPNFHKFVVNIVLEKIEGGLIPVLNLVSKQGIEIDLQDLLGRFAFDTMSSVSVDFDPKSLSIDLPILPVRKALEEVEEVIFNRHVLPSCVWKFQRWLGIGLEKKHKEAWKILDDFIYKCIYIKRSQLLETSTNSGTANIDEKGTDLLKLYMEENAKNPIVHDKINKDDKFLRDTALNFVIAGTGNGTVVSWLLYLLSKNPQVESKIRVELDEMINDPIEDFSKNSTELFGKLIYLHGALCEALRLYPPVVFVAKSPTNPDVLPSGHQLMPGMQIVFSLYAMARMKSIWGDDCCEFKPERWITKEGKIKHEPSYKFLAFNAGPRSCIGKDMALTVMKIVAATVIKNYRIEPIEGFPVVPNVSIMLRMKHGFKVKVVRLRN